MFSALSKGDKKRIYSIISDELASNKIDNATWAQAFSETDGNIDRARALYIKIRFEEIENELLSIKEQERRREKNIQKERESKIQRKNLEAKEAAERILQIKRTLPVIERRLEIAESRLKQCNIMLKNLFSSECSLREDASNSSGFARKIKLFRLKSKRKKIAELKEGVKKAMREKAKNSQVITNYSKELRDLEHRFGRL